MLLEREAGDQPRPREQLPGDEVLHEFLSRLLLVQQLRRPLRRRRRRFTDATAAARGGHGGSIRGSTRGSMRGVATDADAAERDSCKLLRRAWRSVVELLSHKHPSGVSDANEAAFTEITLHRAALRLADALSAAAHAAASVEGAIGGGWYTPFGYV